MPSLLIRALSILVSPSIPVNETTGAPVALHNLLDIVEEKAKKTEGIYRIPRPTKEIKELTENISKGNLDGISVNMNAFLAADTVKKVLRDMPAEQKIFPAQVPKLSELEGEKKLDAAKAFVAELTPEKKAFLTRLLDHFEKVTQFHALNKMTQANLAIVFVPNLFASCDDPLEDVMELDTRKTFFMYVFEHRKALEI